MHCQWLLGRLERERVGGVGLWVMGGETGLMGNRARIDWVVGGARWCKVD